MTDIENELRHAMHAAVDGASYPEDAMDLLRRHRARRKARAAATAAFAVTAVLAATVVAVALHGSGHLVRHPASASTSPHASPSPVTSPVPHGWVRHADRFGDYIDIPATWHVGGGLTEKVPPAVTWVVGTAPVPAGGSCALMAALRRMPADGALFTIMEWGTTSNEPYIYPPRGKTLGLGPRGGPYSCWPVRSDLVSFQDGGRFFQVQAAFGSRASAALRAEVARSLNTLYIRPLPASDQPEAMCRAGHWTYCPQAVWVYQVIGAARVTELGNVGTSAISGWVGNISFGMWTTRQVAGPARGRCDQVAGTRVCRTGQRLWWRVHGLVLWVAPAPPKGTASVGPGLPPRRVLARLIVASRRIALLAS